MNQYKIMIIGFGSIAKAHYNVLKTLNQDIISVVDINQDKLKDLETNISSTDLKTELINKKPEIILISSNTQTHIDVLKKIKQIYNSEKLPSIFIEKPVMDNSYKDLTEFYKNLIDLKYSTAYLIRFSPNTETAIQFLKNNPSKNLEFDIVWKKERGNARPSAGVHIDETTHAIDLILSYLLPKINKTPDKIILNNSKTKYGNTQINIEEQKKLYNNKLSLPSAEIEYQFNLPNQNVIMKGFSSFISGPQERKIIIQTDSHIITLIYDFEKKDIITIKDKKTNKIILNQEFDQTKIENNKMRNEWIDFLHYHKTGDLGKLPTPEQSLFDVFISESLVLQKNEPTIIFDNQRQGFFKIGQVIRQLFSKRNQ